VSGSEPINRQLLPDQATLLPGLLNAAPIGIGLVNNRILGWVNPQFEAIIGYSAAELHGQSARLLYPDEAEYERVGRDKHALIARHGVGSVETRMRRKSGEVIDVLLSSAVLDRHDPTLGLVFTVLDITERKQAEAALIERDRSITALFANLPGMVYRCRNDEFWTMEFLSEGCQEYTGYPPAAFLGNAQLAYADLIHPDDRQGVDRTIQEVLARRQTFEMEYRVILPDRGVRWFWERGCGVFTPDGELVALEGFITDITDRKQLVAQTQQTSKLEAIGQLAGGIAHDFNNLLQVINGYAALLIEDLAARQPDPAHLAEIRKAGERAEVLVRQLLAFSRRQILQPQDVNLNELGDNLFGMVTRMLGEHIEFSFTKDPQIGLVHADPVQLEQVLMNLAINARDAMPGGGRLEVTTRDLILTVADCRQLPGARAGRHVLVTVSDTGEGMDAVVLAQIFEPFFTTKEVGKGTGLGLSMVYGIVQQHGGAITAVSEVGQGTTIKVFLPVASRGARTTGAAGDQTEHCGLETILVVQSEDTLRRLTRRQLEKAGYQVLGAHTGDEAVALVQEHPGAIDLVMLDFLMPGGHGQQVHARLRGQQGDLPVLFCTGLGPTDLPGELLQDRRTGYLQKPFTQGALLRELQGLLAERPGRV